MRRNTYCLNFWRMLWSGVPNTSWILETWSNSLVPGKRGFKLKHKGEQQSYCGSTAVHRAFVGHIKVLSLVIRMLCLFCVEVPHDLKEDTTSTPHVHLKAVVPISEEALWGSVPACGDVFCVWRLGVHAPTWTKVAKLQTILLQFNKKKKLVTQSQIALVESFVWSKLGQRWISLLWECFLALHLCEKSHSCRERVILGGGNNVNIYRV